MLTINARTCSFCFMAFLVAGMVSEGFELSLAQAAAPRNAAVRKKVFMVGVSRVDAKRRGREVKYARDHGQKWTADRSGAHAPALRSLEPGAARRRCRGAVVFVDR